MKKIYLFIGLALSMLAGGCSKDDPIDNPVGPVDKDDVTVKVTATIAEEGLLWSEGATVAINGFESSALATGGEAAATFEIKNVSAPLKVVAPFRAYGAGDVVTVPDTQKYVAGGYDADAFVMYGYAAKFVETEESEETEENKTAAAEVEMHAACGIVKLPVAIAEGSAVISSISLTAANEEAVAGSWKFDFTNGAATAERVFSTVALDCGENGVALGASAVDFRFVIPAAAYAKGVIIEAATTDGHKFVCDYKEALTVVAGAETALEPMDFKIIEKADATLNITIAEPAITWAAGDEVVVNGVLSSAVAAEDAGKSTASFDLKEVAYPYTVLYPRDLYTTSGRLRFYDEQRLLKNEFDREALAMVGYSFDSDVTLHNVCGLVKIPVFNNFEGEVVTLEKVCIRSNDGSPLAGKYNINYRNATLSLVSAVDTMTLVPEEGSKGIEIPIGEKVYVYAVVPEGKFPQGLTLDVYTDVENQTDILCTPAGGLNVTRGVETELETVEYTDVKIEAITTAEEFVEFAKCVNNGRYKKFINSEGEVVLGGDIDMSGVEWTAITGPENAGFDGIFNGQGFAIKNWTSSKSLFSVLAKGATVKNLVLDSSCQLSYPNPNELGEVTYFGFVVATNDGGIVDNVINRANVTLTMDAALAYQLRAGAIIGQSNIGSRITNCQNHGNVTITVGGVDNTASAGASCTQYWGTLQGAMTSSDLSLEGDENRTIMQNCVNTGNLSVTVGGTVCKHGCYVGGLTGTANSYSELIDCSNSGNVTFEVPVATSIIVTGGLTSYSAGAVTNSSNTGNVTFNSKAAVYAVAVGGLTGYQNGPILGCSNDGAIDCKFPEFKKTAKIGQLTCGPNVGGITGLCYTSDSGKSIASITDSTNRGSITFNMTTGVSSRIGVAGIVGNSYGAVTNCENFGTIDVGYGRGETTADKSSAAILCVGGISGCDYYGKSLKTLKDFQVSHITNCKNHADVIFDTYAIKSNNTCGGIVAWPGDESDDCVAKCTDCLNEGNVTLAGVGKVRCGGIMGGSGRIIGCINKGNVTAKEIVGNSCAIGGLCGFHTNNTELVNCEQYGNVEVLTADASVMTGGMIGNHGNNANSSIYGCKVNCNVKTAGTIGGMLVGKFSGTSKVISIGSSESPCYVAGSLTIGANTIVITSDYLTKEYMFGNEATREENHNLFVELLQ